MDRGIEGRRGNDLVLVREDGGLPEASLNDGGTAKLSGLEITHEQRLETSSEEKAHGITYFVQPI